MSTPPSVNPWGWASDATYTNGPRAGSNTKTTPSGAGIAEGHIAGQAFLVNYLNGHLNNTYLWLEWLRTYAGGGYFGDGSDGAATITGGTTTLARNMNYNTLTVTATGLLQSNSYVVRARTSITVQTGGIIYGLTQPGASGAAGGAGGGAGTGAVLGVGTVGGAGGAGVAGGVMGTASNDSYSGASGGDGGTVGGGAGGAGGAAGVPAGVFGDLQALPAFATGHLIGSAGDIRVRGGGGGGGGGCNAVGGVGGGGGGGGRVVILLAPEIIVEAGGLIHADGGVGGAASGAEGGGGGGGGGGGLGIGYRFSNATIAAMIADGRLRAAGGGGGAGSGAGGVAGSPGVVGIVRGLVM